MLEVTPRDDITKLVGLRRDVTHLPMLTCSKIIVYKDRDSVTLAVQMDGFGIGHFTTHCRGKILYVKLRQLLENKK